MRKIFISTRLPPYVADAACSAVLTIASARREKVSQKQGVERADMIIVAGGAQDPGLARNDSNKDFILEQVRMSIACTRPNASW